MLSDPAVRRGMEDLADEVVPMYLAQRGGGAPRDFLPIVPEGDDVGGDFAGYDDGVRVVDPEPEGAVGGAVGGAAGSTRGSAPPSRGSPSKAPSSLGDAGDVAVDAARAHAVQPGRACG